MSQAINAGTSLVTIRPAGRRVEIHIEQCTDTGWIAARAFPEPTEARAIARHLNDYAARFDAPEPKDTEPRTDEERDRIMALIDTYVDCAMHYAAAAEFSIDIDGRDNWRGEMTRTHAKLRTALGFDGRAEGEER